MSRALVGLLLSALTVGGLWPQTGEVRRLRLEPAPIVWLGSEEVTIGANRGDLFYAAALCLAERPLPIETLTGVDTRGACALPRFATEAPRRRVWTAAYGIDRTEVTHAAWRTCVVSGRCPPSRIRDGDDRLSDPRMPVTGVTWSEAQRFCEVQGGRLPTEVEWEHAARGDARHRFPWGRQYNSRLANHGRSPRGPDDADGWALAAPVGSFPDGASPHGLLDMAGNAWEFTASAPRDEDVGLGADAAVYRVIRGGSWAQPGEALRVTHRVWISTSEHQGDLGFRCAYDPPQERRRTPR